MKKLTEEQKAENKRLRNEKRAEDKKIREAQKDAEKLQRMKDQTRVTRIEMSIEWRKSRTWGSNPHMTAKVWGEDKYIGTFNYTCSGCGYDKESTVIADVFNEVLRYKLFLVDGVKGVPYGIHLPDKSRQFPYYDGGIGTDCYSSISEYIGGTFKRVASGKTFDAYTYTDNGTIK